MVTVIIIGAGPAGCELARELSPNFSVTLIDRNVFPRDKICGGILIEASVDFLKCLDPPDKVFSRPKNLNLRYLDWDNKVEFKQKRAFQNINRKEFDNWLFELATKRANVSFVKGEVTRVVQDNRLVVSVMAEKRLQELEADLVVDASGAHSLLRKHRGSNLNIYTAIQFELKPDLNFKDFSYVLADSLSDYYSWIIPKGELTLVGSCFNTGSMVSNVENMREIFKEKAGFNLEGAKMRAAPIIRTLSVENIKLVEGNIFIVGEAAGMISPSTGEGLSYALRSAKACAKAINKYSVSKKALQDYSIRAKPLLDELKDKIGRAKILMDSKKRFAFFKSFSSN